MHNMCVLSKIDAATDGNGSIEEGFRAVTQGVPNSFQAAMVNQNWGDAARTEFDTVTSCRREH